MKIDKVIWASSAQYSDFWNINSFIHKEFLGLDCVLLLYGKKNDLNLSEDYGEIIECETDPILPHAGVMPANLVPQLIFNKWHYTKNEPDTTWLIGDIDQIPLQKEHFIDQLHHVSDSTYVHLAEEAGNCFTPDWKYKRERLVGHYHVAKGKVFSEALNLNGKTLLEHAKTILSQSKLEEKPTWAYEEWYTADLIKQNRYMNRFRGFNRPRNRKICRSDGCSYDQNLVDMDMNHYVDIHCPRPYNLNSELINNILTKFWKTKIPVNL